MNAYNEFRISDEEFYDLVADPEYVYVMRLYSGDILKGHITEFTKDEKKGEGIKFMTYAGEIELFHDQIVEVSLYSERNRHAHREYIMPTARPIGDDHFVGNWEIGMLYGGFGITDYFSVTGGGTLIPGMGDQGWVVNLKATPWQDSFEGEKGGYAFGLGYVASGLGSVNFGHTYINASFWGERTHVMAMVFARVDEQDDFESIRVFNTSYPVNLAPNAVGLAVGMDTRFSSWTDLRFVGELWSPDVSQPTNIAVLGGLRLDNENVAYDFGLTFLTQGFIIPHFAFSWTPF